MRTLLCWLTAACFAVGIVALPLVERDPPRYPERYESAASFDIVTPTASPAHADVPDYSSHIADLRQQQARASRGRPRAVATAPRSGIAPLACLNANEGSPGYGQHDGDPYSGRYQFDQTTWNGAVSRSGFPEWSGRRPYEAPPEVQDAAARQLYSERGTQPWSASARRNC